MLKTLLSLIAWPHIKLMEAKQARFNRSTKKEITDIKYTLESMGAFYAAHMKNQNMINESVNNRLNKIEKSEVKKNESA